jgi:hypothetical protein
MSEFMFGVGRGAPKNQRRINAIAKRHDAYLVVADIPGEGVKHWFCAPNMGHPFDAATAKAVKDDLRAAGLADADGVLAVK